MSYERKDLHVEQGEKGRVIITIGDIYVDVIADNDGIVCSIITETGDILAECAYDFEE